MKISLDAWQAIGRQLLAFTDSATWWIADWLIYGEDEFRDRYQEAIRKTSLSYQTLRNYAWVARQFEMSRRRDNLSFGHHAEVAALEQSEQDYWLRKADELKWSRNQLRGEVRASLKERQRTVKAHSGDGLHDAEHEAEVAVAGDTSARTLYLPLTSDQHSLYEAAAGTAGLSLHVWALQVLETAASCGPASDQTADS